MALVSQSDVEARLKRSLSAEEISAFATINSAVQNYVERMIGSSVEAAEASSRYYDGGRQHLAIDPCTDLSSVIQVDDYENNVYTYESQDYTKEPRNRTLKTMIRHRNTRGFIAGINNIKVTAKFSIYGDSQVRDIVKDAMISAIVSELQNSTNIKRESIEGYSIEFATTEAANSLRKLKYIFPEV